MKEKLVLRHSPIVLLQEFCNVKAVGTCMNNPKEELPPRVRWIVRKCEEFGFEYSIDHWTEESFPLYNIYLYGEGPLMLIAHHDIHNPDSENANDNSASIVNALLLKTLNPNVPICFTDAEEFGLLGAKRLANLMLNKKNEKFAPHAMSVLNLELTGRGGEYFFVGRNKGKRALISEFIASIFDNPTYSVPLNDSVILEEMGIDCCVINPLPPMSEEQKSETIGYIDENPIVYKGEHLDKNVLYLCHSTEDTVSKCSNKEMKEFITEVLYPICLRFMQ